MSRLAMVASVAVLLAMPAGSAAGADAPGALGAKDPSYVPGTGDLAIALRGDIWRVPRDGGAATRVTLHEANDLRPRVSPDGKRIAFSSNRDGDYDVWVSPAGGGAPVQLTHHSGSDIACGWSPDGKEVLFHSNRAGHWDLWAVSASGGLARRITRDGGSGGSFSPDGQRIVFVRGAIHVDLRGYEGSSNYDIYVVDAKGGIPRRLTSTPWNERDPLFSPDGRWIYYLAEKDGTWNCFRLRSDGGEAEQVTHYAGGVRLAGLAMAPDGSEVAFEKDFEVSRLPLGAVGEERRVAVRVESDDKEWTRERRALTDGASDPAWAPDGKQIAFALRGDLWVMSATGGKARRVTSGPGTDRWPRFSPDGQKLAFFSNRSGNQDLWVVDLRGGKSVQLTNHPTDDFFFTWSPDGKQIAFCSERSGNRDIWVIPAEGGEARQLTSDPGADQSPSWSPDGKLIVFEAFRDGKRAIWATEAQGGAEMQLSGDGSGPQWSPDGSQIAFEAERGGSQQIWQIQAPRAIAVGTPIAFVAEVEVDRKDEFVQVFDEAWQSIRDGFYDKDLHGVDWEGVKKRYRPLAERCEIREDLHALIDRMLGELKASHMGISGTPRHVGQATGELGWELVAPAAGGPGLEVASVVPGGPADKAWIRPGDRVFAVRGRDVSAHVDVDRLLERTHGEEVEVVVGTGPDRKAARTVRVKPASRGDIHAVEYEEWVKGRKALVEERGGGKVAYVHLDAMNPENLARFRTALTGDAKEKKALVLDCRNNGGGNIHQELLDILNRKPYIYYQSRGGARDLQQTPVWAKPVVVLINERSYSDAEIFPYGFRAMGLGKLVGVPTSGGVIGTGSETLGDGAKLRMPRTGWYAMDGTNLEGWGIKPDVQVEETPEDRAAGRDPQLAKAVELLLEELHERPRPEAKADPERKPTPPDGKRYGPF